MPGQAADVLQQHPQPDGRVQRGPGHHREQDQDLLDQLRGPDQRPLRHHVKLPQQEDVQGEGGVLSHTAKTTCVSRD